MQEIDLGQRQRGFVVGQAIGSDARHQVDHKIKGGAGRVCSIWQKPLRQHQAARLDAAPPAAGAIEACSGGAIRLWMR